MAKHPIEQIERFIRRDPARRGLLATDSQFGTLCPGHLTRAAADLAAGAAHVGLVTGFYVSDGTPPAAETDGPPGTLALAMALAALGSEVSILTDTLCESALLAAAQACRFPAERVYAYPHDSLDWVESFFDEQPGRKFTHLIAVERAGPSHTPHSLQAQLGASAKLVEQFLSLVPAEFHDRCHNVRGRIIDEHTAPFHRLFEEARRRQPAIKTVGIGDGANEIGMGSIPWEQLHPRLPGEHAPRIPCRIATDWTILAGTSNWGGYALAAATLLIRENLQPLLAWDARFHLQVLEAMVEHGPAVDGITGRREPTVDGLPFPTYIQPCDAIRRLLGFAG